MKSRIEGRTGEPTPIRQPPPTTTCPGCGSADFTPTGAQAPGFSVTVGSRQFAQPSYSVQECVRCALLYRTRVLSPPELEAYYSIVDFRKWDTHSYHPTERAVLATLRSLPRGVRILDFGCSSGRLLKGLAGLYDCYGFEVNREAAGVATLRGLKMLDHSPLAEHGRERFEAIVMVDVFEHLSEPDSIIQKLFDLLKEDGLLLVVTGNGDAKACRLDPAQFWYFRNVEHLCMLTRQHANYLARRCSASLERWDELPHYDTPVGERFRQWMQHFAYWQFQRATLLSRTVLPLLPRIRRAKHWPVAPAFTCSRDHVLAVFRKSSHA